MLICLHIAVLTLEHCCFLRVEGRRVCQGRSHGGWAGGRHCVLHPTAGGRGGQKLPSCWNGGGWHVRECQQVSVT